MKLKNGEGNKGITEIGIFYKRKKERTGLTEFYKRKRMNYGVVEVVKHGTLRWFARLKRMSEDEMTWRPYKSLSR